MPAVGSESGRVVDNQAESCIITFVWDMPVVWTGLERPRLMKGVLAGRWCSPLGNCYLTLDGNKRQAKLFAASKVVPRHRRLCEQGQFRFCFGKGRNWNEGT